MAAFLAACLPGGYRETQKRHHLSYFPLVSPSQPEQYETTWRVNAYGAFVSAKEVAPDMIAKGHGTMLFTGATAGVKAGARSVAFGPAKFALRGLVQSLARDLGPKGVHVA